ncbi:TetR/AcrR family transcriptional regulator [Agromyces sp. NPDC058064]|uniref:TetR/AcrR family transcriptional regulator n=1 Tax=Agromyces sp. NPDC058064 TaxID=3346322 RepID=UPI0036DC229C
MSAIEATTVPGRTRPKDRRQKIAMAAAEAFSERGYHQVSMGDVAAAVGISAPALYRHFPNKYALFVDAAERLAHGLLDATEGIDAAPGAGGASDPDHPDHRGHATQATDASDAARARFDEIVAAVTAVTIENRRTGGLYRWEGRYLEPDDRSRIRDDFVELTARVARALEPMRRAEGRPVAHDDGMLLAAGVLSVVASITAHHTSLPRRPLAELLLTASHDVAETVLPARVDAPAADPAGLPSTSKRELIVREALVLFHRRGYHDTGIEDLSAAVGLTTSGFYRHFASKSDLLLEACLRASERLVATTADALGRSDSPAIGLDRLVDAYVAHSFTNHDLMSVYFSDAGALPLAEQERLRTLQRNHVDEWTALLRAVRPELSAAEARFRVHAGLNVVVDIGRLLHFAPSESNRAVVSALVRSALGVGPTYGPTPSA